MRPVARDEGRAGLVIVIIVMTLAALALVTAIVYRFYGMGAVQRETVGVETLETTTDFYDYEWDESDARGDSTRNAAAAYVLLRANGYTIDRDELDSDIPEDAEAPGVSETLNPILNRLSDTSKVSVPIVGQNLLFVPAPSIVWIADDIGYRPVVFLHADEATATVSDPEKGEVEEHPFSVFQRMYANADSQCVYIADRGYRSQ